ncbi:septum site-determining protein Ssd [Nocardia yamanashiensis]|uniref:septum site-determining protein Ssd n=1 Tax=Nocardia yamanashiensis TaxID=209247 RepID=UPI000831526C|nr:septum site-determining protein Ssd [Nocardia yamanashiensis]
MDNHPAAGAPALVLLTAIPLREEIRRIAAAADQPLDERPALPGRHPWAAAPVIILDTLSARNCVAAGHPRRPGIILVTAEEPSLLDWQTATAVGAEQVLRLPAESDTLITAFTTNYQRSHTRGAVVAIAGACGGAGASTLAAAVALTAATHYRDRTLLIDAAPYGGGLDLLLGIEQNPGLRWPDLAIENGRISAVALHQALPAISGVSVLSCGRGGTTTGFDATASAFMAETVQPPLIASTSSHPPVAVAGRDCCGTAGKHEVPLGRCASQSANEQPSVNPALSPTGVAAVIEAGRSAGDLVVCDLSTERAPHADVILEAADLTVLITPARLRAIVAAESVRDYLLTRNPNAALIVRGPAPGGLRGSDIATTLALPLLAAVPPQPGLPERLERTGLTVNRRGPLRTAAAAILEALPLPATPRRAPAMRRSTPRRRPPTSTCTPAHPGPITSNTPIAEALR